VKPEFEDRPSGVPHGRDRQHPLRIPWSGWKDILRRTYQGMLSDRLLTIAGGVAFFALFALFPAITALVSVYGMFFDASTITQSLSMADDVVPSDVLNLVTQQATRIASQSHGALTLGIVGGLLVTFWSSIGGVKAMIDALNVIYEQDERRGFFQLNLVAFLFLLGTFAVFLVVIGAVAAVPQTLSWLGLGEISATWMRIARWPVMLIVLLIGLAALYRYGPHWQTTRSQWLSVGGVFAALVWIGASYLFSWYLARFDSYNATYGSLGAVVALMMWLWISISVVLLGAQLNSEIERQTAEHDRRG
jgi:membrane protein